MFQREKTCVSNFFWGAYYNALYGLTLGKMQNARITLQLQAPVAICSNTLFVSKLNCRRLLIMRLHLCQFSPIYAPAPEEILKRTKNCFVLDKLCN